MGYMMSDWLSYTGYKEMTPKGHHDTQPSFVLETLYVSEIWAYTYTFPQMDVFSI